MNKPHKNLDVWSAAMDAATQVYRITEKFPADERFGLTSQMRRSAVSVPSNIAEGAARHTRKEFIQFLFMAQGSLSELDTQLELAKRLDLLDLNSWTALDSQLDRIDKLTSGLIRHQRGQGVSRRA